MTGQLFTQNFLTIGIRDTDEWRGLDAPFAEFQCGVAQTYQSFETRQAPNEAVTEEELIRPVLRLLNWTDYSPQQDSGDGIPDHLLFADAESKARADARSNARHRFKDALAIEESKRFGRSLDARDGNRTPHGQISEALSTAVALSDGQIRWGILTNGQRWRLYDFRTRPRTSSYFEADLGELLQPGNEDDLRVFYLLFRREAFIYGDGATTTFLEYALAEGQRYEDEVAEDLSSVVFERVFPNLVAALADATSENLSKIREAALIFLYRVLFVLYAEDRGLLPVNESRYDDYGLRKRVRDDIARRMDQQDAFSSIVTNYFDHLSNLFLIINTGDPSIGLPPYNGGLFAPEVAPLLETVRLPDATIAPIIYDLSHTESKGNRNFVNYRDLSVQQLGSIWERLLERELVREGDEIAIRLNAYARKDSGSFYTSQDLVDLIVARTLKPLAEERLKAFEDKAAALAHDPRPKAERKAELCKCDPAEAVLNLKVMDPAMGSGHFLVTAVDFLADTISELVERVPTPKWLNGEYVSPLMARVTAIKEDIVQRAKASNWILNESQLTDQAIIRRMVLKRCIYGIDKNPLTVELAKVSLWLHSLTMGAPLSFLDHHLRCGDSLMGMRVKDAIDEMNRLGGLFVHNAIAGAEAATAGMQRIEEMSDADMTEVQESAFLFGQVEDTTAALRGLLDFLCGLRYLTAGMNPRELAAYEAPMMTTLGRQPENAYGLLSRGPDERGDGADWSGFSELWRDAHAIVQRERFLHWEVAFPGVWQNWQHNQPEGGFDAVIGNPPWDRIKLQEVEWFASRAPELARAPTATARRTAIQKLRKQADPLAAHFDAAKAQSDKLAHWVRTSGDYPLLGGGDINLYSLFVERAMSLVKPDGIIGLLTPSGIYADKTAAPFFKSVSTAGRVACVFDFENKKIFFPDVHASFKFCAFVFGGENRTFAETHCAFFLHDIATIDDPQRCFPLTPDDFARVNPNTGTAPVFRNLKDAEITRYIYERHPVLVDHAGDKERRAWPVRYNRMFDMTNDSELFRTREELEEREGAYPTGDKERRAWPVKYATMFHMTNDSGLFHTREELEEREGAYPIGGNRFNSPSGEWLPLYQGRMIWQFDHRANSVRINPQSTHNPYLSEEVSAGQHADPDFLPQPQYYVPSENVEMAFPQSNGWALGFRDITNPTNMRTMVASIVPWAGYGNTLPLLIGDDSVAAMCLVANLNALVFDFVTRQKVQGQHLNWFIIEQLPVIAPDAYDRKFGPKTARELVREAVLELTYTAHDMAPFARDLGYVDESGEVLPPFVWDEDRRLRLRAKLDAVFFHLYGIADRDDARYVYSTFPIVEQQETADYGRYLSRDLCLAYMNALAAGDADAEPVV